MEKAKRLAAQFLVFMFWSAVMTAACLIVNYGIKYNSFPPAWRWWDVLGFSVFSAAIIMTGKSVFKVANKFRFWGGIGIFLLWFYGLILPQYSVWIFGQKFGPFWLFLIPSGLGVILIMAFSCKNIGNSGERAIPWLAISIWAMWLVFTSSLAAAKGFYFIAPHLWTIAHAAITAAWANLFLILAMLLIIFNVKGLIILHEAAFAKPRAEKK